METQGVPLRIYCLGHFRIEKHGEPLNDAARTQRKPFALLKTLIALGARDVPDQQLIDALWPDSDGDAARLAFSSALHRLRGALGGEALPLRGRQLSLDPRLAWCDCREFDALLARLTGAIQREDPREAAQLTEQAAGLYRGPFVDGEFEPPELLPARERLHAGFLRALRETGSLLSRTGHAEDAIRLYERGIETDPVSEELHEALMRLLAGQGRMSAALAAYNRLRDMLSSQLGIAPSAEIEKLKSEIAPAQHMAASRTALLPTGPEAQRGQVEPLPFPAAAETPDSPPIALADPIPESSAELPGRPRAIWSRPVLASALAAVLLAGLAISWLAVREGMESTVLRQEAPPPLPETLWVAVLPFQNMSGDATLDYFSDGLAEDLITDLSQFRMLTVIARNSTFQYKGKAVDVRNIGRELGARYVLEGSVRPSDDKERVRITVQLAETGTGGHLWADRYDRELKDVFSLQEELVDKVALAVDVRLLGGEQNVLVRGSTRSYEAYRLFRLGYEAHQNVSPEKNLEAARYFRQAVSMDPGFAAAWAQLGWTHYAALTFTSGIDPRPEVAKMGEYAQRALAINERTPVALQLMGTYLAFIRDFDGAVRFASRAIELDPSNPVSLAIRAIVFNMKGDYESAYANARRAFEVTSFPHRWFHFHAGFALFGMGKPEEAIPWLERTIQAMPNTRSIHVTAIAAYAEAGRLDDARRLARRLLDLDPYFQAEHLYGLHSGYSDPRVQARLRAGVRAAGLK